MTNLMAVIFFLVVFAGCDKTSIMPSLAENEKVVLQAMIASHETASSPAVTNFRTTIEIKGKPLSPDADFELLMFKAEGDHEPLYRFNADEYHKAAQATKCNAAIIGGLQKDQASTGLFCNSSLELTKVNSFVLKTPGASDLSATSLVAEYEDPALGLRSVVIPF